MTATCDICGSTPCATPVFCRACRDADARKSGGESPPPPVESKVAELAALSRPEYDRKRKDEAKKLGIKLATLDREVAAARAQAEEEDAELPHWKIEPWDEPVDGATLLSDLERVFTRYAFLPTGASVALPLWELHAWTMDAGDTSPFMVLVSPTKRCGKTTVLIILYYLTPRSELASNISPSALFRYVEDIRPTLLIDEADSFMKDNEELRGILDSGHTKAAAHVIRNVEINGKHKPRRFSTWAPKAIATIRELADTLEDRAIVLTLQRKPRRAKVERLRKRDNEEFAVLRRKAARWAADNFAKLADPDPQIPDALNDRAADNWRPLLAIADLVGEDWPKRAREAACILSGEGHDTSAINVELLADSRKAFGESEVMTSADLVAALVADPERPWATWGKRDKPLTQNQLARLLRPFGIISETVHPLGRADAKGYKRAHFEEAWAAYLPGQNPSPQPEPTFKASNRPNADETGITRDFQSVQEVSPDGSKNANLSYTHAGLDAWTFGNGGSGDKEKSATLSAPLNTADELPKALRRCDHCGRPGATGEYDWPQRPFGIVLHSSCEAPWYDRERRQ
jgi:putative DNA primase/helicase